MSGSGFGFDKGLLGPTSWDSAGIRTTGGSGQPPRTEAEKAFQSASNVPLKPTPSVPAWPAVAQNASATGGNTSAASGDLSGYDTSSVTSGKDPQLAAAFRSAKDYILGT